MRLKQMTALVSTAMLAGMTFTAQAEGTSVEVGTAFSTLLIDRGESLATINNEFTATIAQDTSVGSVYAALYRISPFGGEARAFDEEVDYTLGFASEAAGVAYDFSANYLTYPGSAEEASLELAAAFDWDHALHPGLAAFYDVDLDLHGAEVFIAPDRAFGDWTGALVLRGGYVGSSAGDYSYAGLEAILGRSLTEAVSFERFVRVEAADEDTFASDVDGGVVTDMSSEGAGLGFRLVARH